jgi:hypothetical protein
MAGAVVVIERKRQFLQMVKKVPPHIRLDIGPHGVAPVGNEKGKAQPEYIDKHHQYYHAYEKAQEILAEQFFQGVPGEHGKDQIHSGDEQGAEHIRREELPVGPVVGRENFQGRTVEIPFLRLILMPHIYNYSPTCQKLSTGSRQEVL